ncbi:MAG: hypothetical protein QG563_23 [Patescibacteria group bacterium]|nr:hypothetical protein [Patescibacteria group bacterium]
MTVGTSNERSKNLNELIISNPDIRVLETHYTLTMWLFRRNQNRDKILETKIELGDLLNTDSNEIDKIVSETNMTRHDIQRYSKHASIDAKNIFNSISIPGM